MLTINTNISSLSIQGYLKNTQNQLAQATERLSSGLRVNSAKDDAAGLAIANSMTSQIRGMGVAIRNSNDAVSLVQTADGALATSTDILQRMRELAVQASNGTYGTDDYTQIDKEYQQLSSELTRIASSTKFNKLSIVDSDAGTFKFQVGADASDTLEVVTKDAGSYLATPGDLTSAANAGTALAAIDEALKGISEDRAVYGATLNRLDFTISNLNIGVQNQSAAKSRIVDADFAQETANMAKAQVLQQAGIAMLAQANQSPSLVLSLLR